MKKITIKLTAFILVAVMLITGFSVSAFASYHYNPGDVDMDRAIGTDDARKILRIALKIGTYTAAAEKLADVDDDGGITPSDARIVLRTAIGLEDVIDERITIYGADKRTELNFVPDMPEASKTPETFTLTVYGYGHGVGLTQYGAVQLDKNGYNYKQILKHYFNGVSIRKDPDYKSTTYYCGSYISTQQLVARITYGEIYGITNYGEYIEACKAQAVAVYTLLKYYNFNVTNASNVGYAGAATYDNVPENLKNAVKDIIGYYMYETSDESKKPILSVFSAAAGGKTCACQDIWGGYLPYLTPVDSSYDLNATIGDYLVAQNTYEISKESMRNRILNYDSSVILSDDPSEWIEILEHSASIDSQRGYVTKVRIGNKYFTGTQLSMGIFPYYRAGSTCMYIQYTK